MAETATPIRKVLTISAINKKLKSDGKSPFWSVTADNGDFYSVFKPDVEARLAEGKHAVMVEENKRGDKVYRNIVGIAEAEMEADGVDLDEIVPGGKEISTAPPLLKKQQNLSTNIINLVDIRAQALACAVQLAAQGVITNAKIESQARIFCEYILHGRSNDQPSSAPSTDDVDQFVAE